MNNHQIVSIIIPTYNSARTVGQVIKSCLDQTYKKLEIIVVDNNSKDNTLDIACNFGVRTFKKGPERGAQRNFGAKMAKGDFYLFLDSDISLSPDVLMECVKLAEDEVAEVITLREYIVGNGFWAECRKIEAQCYFGDDTIEAPRFISRKAFWDVEGYDEDINLTGTEDWDLRERLLEKGYKILRVNAPTYHDEGKIILKKRIFQKCYYAQSFIAYNKKHKGKTSVPFIRKCYLQNWDILIKHPVETTGFIIMKILEGFAALYAMKIKRRSRITNSSIYTNSTQR